MFFEKEFRVAKFVSAFSVKNHAGQVLQVHERWASCFIFTVLGRIEFAENNTHSGERIIVESSPHSPIYIPRGASYLNTCKEDAESIMFNFIDEKGPVNLLSLPNVGFFAAEEAILAINSNASAVCNEFEALSRLYSIVSAMEKSILKEPLMHEAARYMLENHSDSTLDLDRIAEAAHVSKVWLCKRFPAEYGVSPFKYLTQVRMRHAIELIGSGVSVTQTALRVGYSDVYGFSRAYKRYFGHSPSDNAFLRA